MTTRLDTRELLYFEPRPSASAAFTADHVVRPASLVDSAPHRYASSTCGNAPPDPIGTDPAFPFAPKWR